MPQMMPLYWLMVYFFSFFSFILVMVILDKVFIFSFKFKK